MSIADFEKEIKNHEELLRTILEYKNEEGVCIVSHATLAKRLKKNQPWVAKAIKRLNAEDKCIEMIKKGYYIVHYTNIREQGLFYQIIRLLHEMKYNTELYQNEELLSKKYNISEKTVYTFVGYLALIRK